MIQSAVPPDRRTPPCSTPLRDPHSTSEYILDLSTELARMAAAAGLDLLAYLLDMTRIEAEIVVKRTATSADTGKP